MIRTMRTVMKMMFMVVLAIMMMMMMMRRRRRWMRTPHCRRAVLVPMWNHTSSLAVA